jgi:hypothetical protein
MRVSPPMRVPGMLAMGMMPATSRISRFQLRGLGQDDSDTETIGDSDISDLPLTTSPPLDTTSGLTITSDPADLEAAMQSQAAYDVQLETPSGNAITGLTPAQMQAILGANASGSITPAQIAAIISSSGSAAASIIKSTASPYVIPGTSVVYNPATGQMSSSTGLSTTATAITSEISSFLPLILLAVGAMIVLPMLGGGKR